MSLDLGKEGMLRLTVPLTDSTDLRGVRSSYLIDQYRNLVGWLRVWSGRSNDVATAVLLSEVLRLKKSDPGVLLSVINRSSVGGLLRCIYGQLRTGRWSLDAALWSVELQCQLLFELWMAEALEAEVQLSALPARFVASGCRRVVDLSAESVEQVRFRGNSIEFKVSGEWRSHTRDYYLVEPEYPCYWDVVEGIVLTLADNNPLADFETHPDKNGNFADLGGKEPEEWLSTLRGAFALIEEYYPVLYREMREGLQQVVPVGYDEENHLSASYQEYVGSIYVTLHPNLMTMVEALIHEFSHSKLNMLWSLDSVLHNAFEPLFKSPFRPDPRPLHGLLLGLHAFLPIEYFYERLEEVGHMICGDPNWSKRRERLRLLDRDAASVVVANSEATEIVQRLVEELAHWNEYFESSGERLGKGSREEDVAAAGGVV